MENLSIQVGENIRRIRKERGLSLEQVSDLTSVSKAMIGQIERGESNPTVAILWKIANGLKISFSSLLEKLNANVSVIHYEETIPILEDDGRYIVYPIFPFDPMKKWESFRVELKPECSYTNEGHPKGVEEYITVLAGELTMKIDNEYYQLKEGSSIRFAAHHGHQYLNQKNKKAICQMMIYYGGG
jgi:XRE family transcriptional regulator, regulator of sulfur utilization